MLVIDKDTPNVADLKSLKGIEKFTYLRNIYITGATALEDADLSSNTWLETISLSLANGVETLKFPVSADYVNPVKVELIFSDPAANVGPASLDFSPLAKHVSSITIKNAAKLSDMNLAGCEQLASLDIATGLDALTTLDITESPLLVDPAKVLFGEAMKEVIATDAQKAALSSTYPNINWGKVGVEKAIVDPNLKAYVIEQFDTDKDGILSQEEADAATELYARTYEDGDQPLKKITSLKGIEIFPNLITLVAGNMETLDDVDLTKNTKLTTVELTPNKGLTSINVTNMPALTSFVLGFSSNTSTANCVGPTEIDLSGCAELTKVKIDNARKVTSVNLTGCTKVVKYGLRGCSSLEVADISPCPLLVKFGNFDSAEGFVFDDYKTFRCTQAQKDALAPQFAENWYESITWDIVD